MKKLKLILTSLAVVIAVTAALTLREYNRSDNCNTPKPTTTNPSSPTPVTSTPTTSTSTPSTQAPAQP